MENSQYTKNELKQILAELGVINIADSGINAFICAEDGCEYSVWKIERDGTKNVLKKAKGMEIECYSSFFKEKKSYIPEFLGYRTVKGKDFFITEFIEGEDLSKCRRDSLKKTLNSLSEMQNEFWERKELFDCAVTMERSLKAIQHRGNYLGSSLLEKTFSEFVNVYKKTPRTLCHDDLLPLNVIVNDERAVFIDWEYGGILPYPLSFARLISHAREDEDYIFFMGNDDRDFAIEYYYEHMVKRHGIEYDDYRRTLDYFMFYEYCEWIMLGNEYNSRDDERFGYYSKLAENKALEISG